MTTQKSLTSASFNLDIFRATLQLIVFLLTMSDTGAETSGWRAKCPLGVCREDSYSYDLATVKQSAARGCSMCALCVSACDFLRRGWTDRAVALKQIRLPGPSTWISDGQDPDEGGREITMITESEVRGRFHFVVRLSGNAPIF